MQETSYKTPEGYTEKLQEFFKGKTPSEILQKMDQRLTVLKEEGHTLMQRIKVGRNEPCPCGSGKKFKKCCLNKCT